MTGAGGHKAGAEINAVKCSVCMQGIFLLFIDFSVIFHEREGALGRGLPGRIFRGVMAAGCPCATLYRV